MREEFKKGEKKIDLNYSSGTSVVETDPKQYASNNSGSNHPNPILISDSADVSITSLKKAPCEILSLIHI